MKEVELASKVVAHFSEGFEVFKEVDAGGPIIDIVLRAGPLITAIECKTTFSIDVIQQAYANKYVAHYSYVAVPYARGFALQICRDYGIGVLGVSKHDGSVHEQERPAMNRRLAYRLKLSEFHKQNEAGVQHGRVTTFGHTVNQLRMVVRKKPGIKMDDALKEIDYHYGSAKAAKSALYGWISKGVIKDIRHERGKLFLVA